MKTRIGILLILFMLGTGCQKSDVDPELDEIAATVTGIDYTMCGCCGGHLIKIGDKRYRADLRDYTPNTPIWIRFRLREDGCANWNWIDVISIRKR